MLNNQILIIDDDSIISSSLKEMLEIEGYSCHTAETSRVALAELEKSSYSIVITDINLPDGNGIELVKAINKYYPEIVPIVITGYGSIINAVEAIKEGAFEYITKPIDDKKLLGTIARAASRLSLTSPSPLANNNQPSHSLHDIVGCDYKMLKIFEMIEAVAATKATVLVTGKSGTGKSITARAIHNMSERSDSPFVEVSCGTLSETLLESELFGHVKGAFTGAESDKDGKLLAANGGTLFLDEINSASPALQVKLLRAIQERQFEPVGSNKTETVDVRIILATNTDLSELVKQNLFREDLYYRINVVNIKLPELSERISDIPLLADYFLNKMCQYHNKSFAGFNEAAIEALENYCWPGNVRELENAIERAVVLGRENHIQIEDLPETVLGAADSNNFDNIYPEPISLKKAMESPEKEIIIAALKKFSWNRNKTAEVLEINRTTLYKKMKYYNLTGS